MVDQCKFTVLDLVFVYAYVGPSEKGFSREMFSKLFLFIFFFFSLKKKKERDTECRNLGNL